MAILHAVQVDRKPTSIKQKATTAMARQEFRKLCPHGRRIRGTAQVEGQVQREGPAMMLIKNLADPRYVREVYGSVAGMAERFAQVKPATVKEAKRITGLLP